MANEWVVLRDTTKLMEADATEVLNFVRSLDPFICELEDGMTIDNVIVSRAPATEMDRNEQELAMWSFSRTLHKQIHDAANASHRGEYNKCKQLLILVHERLDHFASRHLGVTDDLAQEAD